LFHLVWQQGAPSILSRILRLQLVAALRYIELGPYDYLDRVGIINSDKSLALIGFSLGRHRLERE
jgi:hypothetical protein